MSAQPLMETPTVDSIVYSALALDHSIKLRCLNGPCEGSIVEAPFAVMSGVATALRWMTSQQAKRYAVYVVVDHLGLRGLMYLKSYSQPHHAEQKVGLLTVIARSAVS
jgi:hypothetical protein